MDILGTLGSPALEDRAGLQDFLGLVVKVGTAGIRDFRVLERAGILGLAGVQGFLGTAGIRDTPDVPASQDSVENLGTAGFRDSQVIRRRLQAIAGSAVNLGTLVSVESLGIADSAERLDQLDQLEQAGFPDSVVYLDTQDTADFPDIRASVHRLLGRLEHQDSVDIQETPLLALVTQDFPGKVVTPGSPGTPGTLGFVDSVDIQGTAGQLPRQ